MENYRRYWLGREVLSTDQIDGECFHHIVKVCRHKVGEKIELLDGQGQAHLVEITSIAKKQMVVEQRATRSLPQAGKPHLHLAVSFPKAATLEWILEKSVELGVSQVTPFFSEYSQIRDLKKLSSNKWARFEKIILSATEQSGRGDLMRLNDPISFSALLEVTSGPAIMAYEKSESALQRPDPKSDTENLTLFVGSEGGFSAVEVEHFQASCQGGVVSLGPLVLRCETACMALVARVQQLLTGL